MDLSIHIQTQDEQKYQEVIDALAPLGVEIVAGESDPLVMALFYLSRINTKLDNLGQLRHLYKMVQSIAKITESQESQKIYYDDLMKERRIKQQAALLFAADRAKEAGHKMYNTERVRYMTFQEIVEYFDV